MINIYNADGSVAFSPTDGTLRFLYMVSPNSSYLSDTVTLPVVGTPVVLWTAGHIGSSLTWSFNGNQFSWTFHPAPVSPDSVQAGIDESTRFDCRVWVFLR